MPRQALVEPGAGAGALGRVVAGASKAAPGAAVVLGGRPRPRAQVGPWQAGAAVEKAAARRPEGAELQQEAADPEVWNPARAGRRREVAARQVRRGLAGTAARAVGQPRKVVRRSRTAAAVVAPVPWATAVAQGRRSALGARRLCSGFSRSHGCEAGLVEPPNSPRYTRC